MYALRLLLTNVCGPKSYKDLRTVKVKMYNTFQGAAIARGLVKNDQIWIDCMNEANEHEINIYLLRKLFVTIILNCDVGNHKAFLLKCKNMLIADLVYKYKNKFRTHPNLNRFMQKCNDKNSEELYTDELFQKHFGHFKDGDTWTLQKFALNSCLCQIETMLGDMMNKSLGDFGLPKPNIGKEKHLKNLLIETYVANEDDLRPEVAEEFFHANHKLLNKCQKNVFNRIKDLIENKNNDGKIIFLDAPGGTRKPFTLNVIISWTRMNNLEVAATATSGIAATLLHLGRTAHNRFKILVDDLKPRSTCNVARQSETAKCLSNISLAIIDKGPMLHRLCYEAIDRTMKDMVKKRINKKVWWKNCINKWLLAPGITCCSKGKWIKNCNINN